MVRVSGYRQVRLAFTALVVVVSAGVSSLVPERAYAYVDPSVITYAIQATAGVIVALSAIAGVALRRTRKWLFGILGINPEDKKAADARYQRFDNAHPEAVGMSMTDLVDAGLAVAPGDSSSFNAAASTGNSENAGSERGGSAAGWSPKWPVRFGIALVVSVMAVGTLLFVSPLEIVAASSTDFQFGVNALAPHFLRYAVGIALAVALGLSVFRGRAFSCLASVVFAIGVGFWLQAMFMNVGLTVANGVAVDWSKYDDIALVSAAVWVAVIAVSVVASLKRRRIAQVAFVTLAAALIVIQGVGVVSLLIEDSVATNESRSDSASWAITEDGLFDISDKDNVVVFVLDTFDTYQLIEAVDQDPALLDSFTGFTWYKNIVGSMIPTRYGVSFLLTDERPHSDDTWSQFKEQRYYRSSFLSDIVSQGYAVGLYSTDYLCHIPAGLTQETAEQTVNMHPAEDSIELDVDEAISSLTTCALYRDLPWVLKPRFWFNTADVSSQMVKPLQLGDFAKTAYGSDDAALYQDLKTYGLSVNDRGKQGDFRFIHLYGTHEPYTLNAKGERVAGSTSAAEQAIGTMQIVEYYLDELKLRGLYDDATIVITADHGLWNWDNWTEAEITTPTTPILLAKPSQTYEEANAPLVESDAPVAHDDVCVTVLEAVGADASGYSGKSLFSYTGDEDPDNPRYYLHTVSDTAKDVQIVEYVIVGDALDLGNWAPTGRVWNAQE